MLQLEAYKQPDIAIIHVQNLKLSRRFKFLPHFPSSSTFQQQMQCCDCSGFVTLLFLDLVNGSNLLVIETTCFPRPPTHTVRLP